MCLRESLPSNLIDEKKKAPVIIDIPCITLYAFFQWPLRIWFNWIFMGQVIAKMALIFHLSFLPWPLQRALHSFHQAMDCFPWIWAASWPALTSRTWNIVLAIVWATKDFAASALFAGPLWLLVSKSKHIIATPYIFVYWGMWDYMMHSLVSWFIPARTSDMWAS